VRQNHSSSIRNFWNKLPDYVVQAPSTASFKKRLFSFINSAGAEHVLTLFFAVFYSDVMATRRLSVVVLVFV